MCEWERSDVFGCVGADETTNSNERKNKLFFFFTEIQCCRPCTSAVHCIILISYTSLSVYWLLSSYAHVVVVVLFQLLLFILSYFSPKMHTVCSAFKFRSRLWVLLHINVCKSVCVFHMNVNQTVYNTWIKCAVNIPLFSLVVLLFVSIKTPFCLHWKQEEREKMHGDKIKQGNSVSNLCEGVVWNGEIKPSNAYSMCVDRVERGQSNIKPMNYGTIQLCVWEKRNIIHEGVSKTLPNDNCFLFIQKKTNQNKI